MLETINLKNHAKKQKKTINLKKRKGTEGNFSYKKPAAKELCQQDFIDFLIMFCIKYPNKILSILRMFKFSKKLDVARRYFTLINHID